ncbi:MAG: FctA domain-containing protein [Lachnospiraceae bacterium]|nr:FctA domain-containing protein [Lachnospiraceae bacterium]
MKRSLKKLVAMIALFAMLMQNSYTAFAAMEGSEPISEQPEITVEHEDEAPVNENTEEGTEIEYVDGDLDVTEENPTSDVNYDDEVMPLEEKITEEQPVDEALDENLEILENQISGSGLDSVEIYVDTEDLNNKDTFRIAFTGPDSASYDAIINETLDKAASGTYSFRDLNKEGFNIRVTSEDNVKITYSSKNGTPVIKVSSVDEEKEKSLDTKVLTTDGGSPITAIVGEGYDSVKISINTEELPNDILYTFYVDTNADATVDGKAVKNGVKGFDNTVDSLVIDDLDGEEFTAYVIGEDNAEIANVVSIESVDDGLVKFNLKANEIRTKRVYEYSDDKVSVKATLQYPEAVPDDAEFVVTEITPQSSDYNYRAYMKALNDNAEMIDDNNESYSDENTLLYDVAFFVTDEDGNKIEFQPEIGSVSISITFKNKQLEEKADDASDDEETTATLIHMPLVDAVKENVDSTAEATNITADDIKIEVVAEDVSVSAEKVDFSLSDFSVIAATINGRNVEIKVSDPILVKNILGEAINYGITANEATFTGHCDTNFATGLLKGNAQLTQGKFTGNHNPGDDIIGDYNDTSWWAHSEDESKAFVIETTPKVGKILRKNNLITSRNILIDDTHDINELQNLVSSMVNGTASNTFKDSSNTTAFSDIAKKISDNKYEINIKDSKYIAGTYIVNFDNGQYAKTCGQASNLNIILRDDQKIVFNIPDSTVSIMKYEITVGDKSISSDTNDANADSYLQHVIWNIYSDNATVSCNGMFGIVLAPKGNVSVGGTSTGWIVCNKFTGNAGEWHGVWKDMPQSEVSAAQVNFYVKKTLINNGDETPEFEFELWETGPRYFSDTKDHGEKISSKIETIPVNSYDNNIGRNSFKTIKYNSDADLGDHYYVIKEIQKENWEANHVYGYAHVVVDKETGKIGKKDITKYVVTRVEGCYELNNDFTDRTLKGAKTVSCTNPEFQFENTRKDDRKSPAKLSFQAKKSFVDNKWPKNGSVTLVLEACGKDDSAVTVKAIDGSQPNWVSATAPMPAGSNGNIKKITVKDSNVVDFGEIEFPYDAPQGHDINRYSNVSSDGICRCYMYKVYEEIPEAATWNNVTKRYEYNGVSYDPTIRTIKVWVNHATGGANGNLTVTEVNCLDYNRPDETKNAVCVAANAKEGYKYSDGNIHCNPYNGPTVFTNSYAASGKGSLIATKVLEGRDPINGEFEVELTARTSGAPMPAETKVANVGNKFTFGEITFNAAGTYEYQLKEVDKNDPKIEYARESITVTFDVTDKGDGSLTVDGPKYSTGEAASFKNIYNDEVSVSFKASKKLNGAALTNADGKNFTFTIESSDDNTYGRDSGKTFTDGNNDVVTFKGRTYTTADIGKTYHYVIKETNDKQAGISYSTATHEVVVAVSFDEETKQMKADMTVDDAKVENGIASVTFDNYTEGSAALKVKKVFEGKSVKGYKFKVTDQEKGTSTIITTGDDGYATYTIDKKFTVNDLEGQAEKQYVFKVQEQLPDDITSTTGVEDKKGGFYKYKGIIYDLNEYNYVVVLSKNGNAPQIKYYKDTNKSVEITDALEIKNKYEITGTKQHVEAIKTFNEKTLKAEDGTYYFTVKDANGNKKTVAAADGGKVVFDDFIYDAEGDYVYTIYESDADGVKVTNSTSNPVKNDLTEWTATIKVTDVDGQLVASNPEYAKGGTKQDGVTAALFNNESYSGDAKIKVQKYLKDRNGDDLKGRGLVENEFAFSLYATNEKGEKVGKALATEEIDATGSVTFEGLKELKHSGYETSTKKFVIEETEKGQSDKVKAVKGSQIATVTYTFNDVTKEFVAKVTYEVGEDAAEFTNKWQDDAYVEFGGTKTLVGRKLTKDTFSVGLYNVEPTDTVISDETAKKDATIATAPVDAKGKYSFSGTGEDGIEKLNYTEADAGKEFKYWLREETPAKALENAKSNGGKYIDENGIEYDSKIVKVTVKVSYNEQKKELEANVTEVSSNESKDAINFTNKDTNKVNTSIEASKVLVNSANEEIALGDREFNFYLLDEAGNELKNKKNSGSSVSFTNVDTKALEYDIDSLGNETSKNFIYYLVEEHYNDATPHVEKSVTYDQTKYKVVVKVSVDETTGQVKVADPVYYDAEENIVPKANVKFRNKYKAEGDLDLKIKKTFTGRDLTADDKVSFTLKEVGTEAFGAPVTLTIPTVEENGKYVFETTEFKKVFTYTEKDLNQEGKATKYYYLSENDMGAGIKENGETYVIRVELEDKGNGTINVDKYVRNTKGEAVKTSAWDAVKAALKNFGNKLTGDYTFDFVNTYEASGKIQFSAKKIMDIVEGNDVVKSKKFKFILNGTGLKKNENVVTAKRDDNGEWTVEEFDVITYDKPGNYTYTITEENAGKTINGITYSDVTYTYNVAVTDNGDGTLAIAVTDADENVVVVTEDTTDGVKVVKPATAEFTNTYSSSASIKIGGIKVSRFFADNANNTYTFKLESDKPIRGSDLKELTDKSLTADVTVGNGTKSFTFDEIYYTEADYGNEYTYVITEEVGKDGNIKWATEAYTIKVKLTYDENGELKATAYEVKGDTETELTSEQLESKCSFTNIYAQPEELVMNVTKTVNDGAVGPMFDKFTFSCVEVDKDGNAVTGGYSELNKTLTNTGTVTFKPSKKFTVNDVGTYYYKITEDTAASPIANMVYDPSVYLVTAVVSADNGKVSIDSTYKKTKGSDTSDPESITFNNEYEAVGNVTLSGIKTLEGKALATEEASKYSAKLYKTEDDAKAQSNAIATATVDNRTGKFAFSQFNYAVKDNTEGVKKVAINSSVEEKYYIRETTPEETSGVTYDSVIYEVTWTVTDNMTGALNVTKPVYKVIEASNTDKEKKSDKEFAQAELKNCYEANGSFDPVGFKKMIGRDLEDNEFDFQIKYLSFTPLGGTEVKKGDTKSVKNTGNVVQFNHQNVPFLRYELNDKKSDVGLHKYEISEIEGKLPGVDYSHDTYEIWVNVTDNGYGTLIANVDENSPSKWSKYRLNEATGVLEKLTSDAADKITADIQIDGEQDEFLFGFKNTYVPKGYIDIAGTKVLEGRLLEDSDLFTFEMTREDMPGVKKTLNSGDKISFVHDETDENDILNFTKEGTYNYIISETPSGAASVTSSQRLWKVTVEVKEEIKDGKHTGTLIPDITYVGSKENKDVAVWEPEAIPSKVSGNSYSYNNVFEFINKYNASAKIKLNGIKKVKTSEDAAAFVTEGTMLAGHRFVLLDSNNKTVEDVISKTDGSYEFKELEYNSLRDLKDGYAYLSSKTFNYKVVEWNPVTGTSHVTNPGQTVKYGETTYDTSVHTIDVTISATKSNQLGVAVKIDGADVTGEVLNGTYVFRGAEFTNIINRKTQISGTKTWVDNVKDASSRPDVEVFLYANGYQIDKYTIVAPATSYTFNDLPALDNSGKEIVYTVEEKPVAGYSYAKNGYDFINTAGDIKILKIDATTGESLAGAELAIFDGATELERWTSTYGHHVVTSALKGGSTYTLRELSAPAGYMVAADKSFTVPTDGSAIEVTMEDTKIVGNVRLTKRDAATRDALSGAEFALYREDGTRVYAVGSTGSYRYTSATSNGVFAVNSSGVVEITELPYGTYYFTETKAPEGYSLSSERLTFTVSSNGATEEVSFLDTKILGAARLRKVNAGGARSLAGAVFELYAKTPTGASSAIASTIYSDVYYRVGRYTTDATGSIYVGDLPWDDYYFIEVEAPDGYEINTDVNGDPLVYRFTVGDSGTADMVYDLGSITNAVVPETPPEEGVAGRRRGGVLSGVLGVRQAPKRGVLGERVGPATGDTANIILWMLLLLVSIGAIIGVGIAGRKKKRA